MFAPFIGFQHLGGIGISLLQIKDWGRGIALIALFIRTQIESHILIAQAVFHFVDTLHTYTQFLGHGTGFVMAKPAQTGFELTQIEEQFALRLRGGDFDDAPVLDDEFVNFSPNPMHRKGNQTHPNFRVIALHGFHQTDVAFLDEVGQGQSITQIATRNVGHKPQVAQDQLAGRFKIAALAKTPRQGAFFFCVESGHQGDRPEIVLDGT